MATIYLPRDGRTSPATEHALDRVIQDHIRIDPNSKVHALFNGLVTERERMLGLLSKMRIEPWAVDTRSPGSVERADGTEDETVFDDLLHGPPKRWRLGEPVTAWTGSEIVLADGTAVTPKTADRAVMTGTGLMAQSGDTFFRDEGAGMKQVRPEADGVFPEPAHRHTLTARADQTYGLIPAGQKEKIEVDFEMKGLQVQSFARGRVVAEIDYVSTRYFEEAGTYTLGDILSEEWTYLATREGFLIETKDEYLLGFFDGYTTDPSINDLAEAGYILADDGSQVGYTIDEARDEITIEGPGTLYYNARHISEGSDGNVSMRGLAEKMYEFPSRYDIKLFEEVNPLGRIPGHAGPVHVDRTGYINNTRLGHSAESLLAGEFHVFVLGKDADGATILSLVEHNTGAVRLQQRFPSINGKGITWTSDNEIALVDATDDAFQLRPLLDVRPWQADGLAVAETKRPNTALAQLDAPNA